MLNLSLPQVVRQVVTLQRQRFFILTLNLREGVFKVQLAVKHAQTYIPTLKGSCTFLNITGATQFSCCCFVSVVCITCSTQQECNKQRGSVSHFCIAF